MTDATIDTIWEDDLLGRKDDAAFLERFLVQRMEERKAIGYVGSYVLNIDAGWGFGKSFFMDKFKQQLELSNHPVVIIDAWKNDFSDDPYTNVIAEIEQYFQTFLDNKEQEQSTFSKAYDVVKTNAAKLAWIAFKGAAKRASRYVIAEGTEEIKEVFDQHVVKSGTHGQEIADATEAQFIEITGGIIDSFAQKRLDEFNEAKVSLDLFRESLGNLLTAFGDHTGKKLPLFILIDELDRCRPTYAIAMLERIKHLFDADNVVFVLSTDTTQLAHSINAVYGSGFDSRRYLQRFFTRTYELPNPTTAQMIESLLGRYSPDLIKWAVPGSNQDIHDYLSKAALHYEMSLREIEQSFDILASLTTVWDQKFPIQLGIIVPLILGHIRGKNIADFSGDGWIRQLATKTPRWHTEDSFRSRNGFDTKHEKNPISKWIVTVLDAANKPLADVMTANPADTFPSLQAHDLLGTEYNGRFGSRVIQDVRSIIMSYPDLVRHAGRLSI